MNDLRDDHQLDEVVRETSAKGVDIKVHGPGYHRTLDAKKQKVSDKPPLISKLVGGDTNLHYYYIKQHSKPFVIKDWPFLWAEGTSGVELEFTGRLELTVDTEAQASALVKALGGYESPTTRLHKIIDKHMYSSMTAVYDRCVLEDRNILENFGVGGVGVGESAELNRDVSQRVSADLDVPFRVGFKLRSAPPLQVDIKKFPTSFDVADSHITRKIETNALLTLANFQKYKRSGLANEADVRACMEAAIEDSVKRHLFGRPFYDVVQHFSKRPPLIQEQIRTHLQDVAAEIGYELKMFQTLIDIESVKLLDGLRIDMGADSVEFRTRHSNGYVKISVSIEVTAKDFILLKRLIDPNVTKVEPDILRKVESICRDEISKIDRRAFNLEFESKVVPAIETALTDKLEKRYGLDVAIINIEQAPTEDARRFQSISRNTQPFVLHIEPLADAGETDPIDIECKFEIINMSDDGWEKFEAKDYGYRADSPVWTPTKKAALALDVGERIDQPSLEDIENERRAEAIRHELQEIAGRIQSAIETHLEKTPGLAKGITQIESNEEVSRWAKRIAATAIEDEWGLIIELREFKLLKSDSERIALLRREKAREMIEQRLEDDVQSQKDLIKARRSGDVTHLQALFQRRTTLLLDEDIDRDAEEIREELKEINDEISRLTPKDEAPLDVETARLISKNNTHNGKWSLQDAIGDNSYKRLGADKESENAPEKKEEKLS